MTTRTELEPLETVDLDSVTPDELTGTFAPPRWLRDLGRSSWFAVGVLVAAVAVLWLLAKMSQIVLPVLTGLTIATVTAPAVSTLRRHGIPRALGALAVLIALIIVSIVIALLVIGGISAQGDKLAAQASAAADKASGWLEDAGVDSSGAESTKAGVESSTSQIVSTLTKGVAAGISGIASVAFFLSFTAFAVFFLLKDGPALRRWLDRHLGVPLPLAHAITGNVVSAVRRYFIGVTIVATFNAVVVGLGALVLDVPLAGTIAVVTLVTAYVPFIGAVVSGAFAVVLTLGANGTSDALIMLVIVLLANGLLQNVVQPIAFGATLDINPLLVLFVTIGGGALFGTAGLILAAPLTSAVIHISADVARIRAAGPRDRDAADVAPRPG
jgi:predicted PurR-regulated permease PerM